MQIGQEEQALLDFFMQQDPSHVSEQLEAFRKMMMMYQSAIREVTTKLEILNAELSLDKSQNPIESVKSRVKTPISIAKKLKRKGHPFSIDAIQTHLNDVAGIRVICSFIDDIYRVADMLTMQDDVTVVAVKDYIKNPKPNGYRSYHMILEIPVFLSDRKQPMKVEVQIRTVAMDFWASLEHRMKYKSQKAQLKEEERIIRELKQCADVVAATDAHMMAIRQMIEQQDEKSCPLA